MRWLKETLNQRTLDRWYPTVVRYLGVGTLIYALFFSHNPALIPAATGMIFFMNVIGGRDRHDR